MRHQEIYRFFSLEYLLYPRNVLNLEKTVKAFLGPLFSVFLADLKVDPSVSVASGGFGEVDGNSLIL
jgi:hypothetical protein